MDKFAIHLWFDKEASEAAEFYVSLFENSAVTGRSILNDTPSGTVEIVTANLAGISFMLMSAGPFFKFNPSISFMISCTTEEEVNHFWDALSDGGEVLMPLETYEFSPKYGWTIDKYGLSWQVFHTGGNPVQSKITPSLMFVGGNCGKAREAVQFYTDTFRNSKVGTVSTYGEGQEPNEPDFINYIDFELEGMRFSAMDSAYDHDYDFNEAISIVVNCESQEELDHYWDSLTAVPEAEQCGWLKDKYGVAWQIVPKQMEEMMHTGTPEQMARVTEAFLKMKKFDIATLEKAYQGE